MKPRCYTQMVLTATLIILTSIIINPATIPSISTVRAHKVPPELESQGVRIQDETFMTQSLNTGEGLAISGEIVNLVKKPLSISLSVACQAPVPGRSLELISISPPNGSKIRSGGAVPYEIWIKGLEAGRYHIHTQIITDEGPSLGPGQNIQFFGANYNPEPYNPKIDCLPSAHTVAKKTVNESSTVTSGTIQIPGFLKYQDPNSVMEIQYPFDWDVIEEKNGLEFKDPAGLTSLFLRTINAQDLYSQNLSDLVAKVTQDLGKTKGFKLLKSDINASLSGHPAVELIYDSTPENNVLRTIQSGTIVGEKFFLFIDEVPRDRFSDYLPVIRTMLSSFRLLSEEENLGQNLNVSTQVKTQSSTSAEVIPFLNNSGSYPLHLGGQVYPVSYIISGGKVSKMTLDKRDLALLLDIEAAAKGNISLVIPRDLIDSKRAGTEEDNDFIITHDADLFTPYVETETDSQKRTLLIDFTPETAQIKIEGTQIAKENESELSVPASNFTGSNSTNGLGMTITSIPSSNSSANNNPPVAIDQEISTAINTPQNITLIGRDPENGNLTYFIYSPPLHGELTSFDNTTGTLQYTPAQGYSGIDEFHFQVNDGTQNGKNNGRVTIMICSPELIIQLPETLPKCVSTTNKTILPTSPEATTNKSSAPIKTQNSPPFANAGADQVVNGSTVVILDGSASMDPESHKLIYNWYQMTGPAVNLLHPNSANPVFAAPSNSTTPLSFVLLVNDGTQDSKPDIVTVTVGPNTAKIR